MSASTQLLSAVGAVKLYMSSGSTMLRTVAECCGAVIDEQLWNVADCCGMLSARSNSVQWSDGRAAIDFHLK